MLVGADDGGVDLDEPVDVAGSVRRGLDLLESMGEDAVQGIAAEAGKTVLKNMRRFREGRVWVVDRCR